MGIDDMFDDVLFEDDCYTEFGFVADDWVGERRGVWRCADGTIVKIREMGDQHLANTIAYIERKEADYQSGRVYRALKREQKRREQANG